MELLLPILRIVHIVCGVFWAGTVFFVVWLLEPSTRAAGPAGGQVMGELIKRGYLTILPVMGGLTIVAGAWLYWIVSGGLSVAWGHTPLGAALTVGALAAIVAFGIGGARIQPAGRQLSALSAGLATAASDEERAELMAQIPPLQDQIRSSLRWVAALLLVAVVAMAVARYL